MSVAVKKVLEEEAYAERRKPAERTHGWLIFRKPSCLFRLAPAYGRLEPEMDEVEVAEVRLTKRLAACPNTINGRWLSPTN